MTAGDRAALERVLRQGHVRPHCQLRVPRLRGTVDGAPQQRKHEGLIGDDASCDEIRPSFPRRCGDLLDDGEVADRQPSLAREELCQRQAGLRAVTRIAAGCSELSALPCYRQIARISASRSASWLMPSLDAPKEPYTDPNLSWPQRQICQCHV